MGTDIIVFDDEVNPEGLTLDLLSDVLVFDAPAAPLQVDETADGDFLLFDAPDPGTTVVEAPLDFFIFDAPPTPIIAVGESGEDFLVITSSGPVGPIGPTGATGGVYTHEQVTPSSTWVVEHGLNRYVSVDVYVDNLLGLSDVEYIDLNTVSVTFPTPTSGVAAVR